MAHIRSHLRRAVVDVLTDRTGAGKNVLAARPRETPEMELPTIYVTALTEQSQRGGDGLELERRIDVSVVCYVSADEGTADDVADALALEIEAAMAAFPTLQGAAFDHTLTTTEIGFVRGARSMAVLDMTFAVEADETSLADM